MISGHPVETMCRENKGQGVPIFTPLISWPISYQLWFDLIPYQDKWPGAFIQIISRLNFLVEQEFGE